MVEHKIENEGGSGVGPYSAHPFRPSMPPWPRHLSCLRCALPPGPTGFELPSPPPPLPSENKWTAAAAGGPRSLVRSGFYCGLIGGFGRINSPRLAPSTDGHTVLRPTAMERFPTRKHFIPISGVWKFTSAKQVQSKDVPLMLQIKEPSFHFKLTPPP